MATERELEELRRLSPAASRAFLGILDEWQLTDAEGAALLGAGVAPASLAAWRADALTVLERIVLLRISLVLRVYESLERLFRRTPDRHVEWLRLARTDAPFFGLTPLAFAVAGGPDGLAALVAYLDEINGGPPTRSGAAIDGRPG